MTLYELDNKIQQFIDDMYMSIDEDTGEVKIDVNELDALQAEREEKWDNIACYIKNLEADAKAIKEEAAILSNRAKAATNKAEWLRSLLSRSMQNANQDKFKSSKSYITFKPSTAVIIPDDKLVDEAYVTHEDNLKIDKVAIKKVLDAGGEVRGAFLEHRQNIQIK